MTMTMTMTMTDILLAARAEGLSYGQYVAKHRPHTSFEELEDANILNKRRFNGENAAAGSRTCEYCGNIFISESGQARFCSARCRKAYSRMLKTKPEPKLEKICVVCGEPFRTNCPGKVCCSEECSVVHKRQWASQKWERTKAERAPAHCAICGKEMVKYRRRRYCSPECLREMNRRRSAAYRAAHSGSTEVQQ